MVDAAWTLMPDWRVCVAQGRYVKIEQIGVAQPDTAETCLMQARAGQICTEKVSACQIGKFEVGFEEIYIEEARRPQIGAPKRRVTEVRREELGSAQIGIAEV